MRGHTIYVLNKSTSKSTGKSGKGMGYIAGGDKRMPQPKLKFYIVGLFASYCSYYPAKI